MGAGRGRAGRGDPSRRPRTAPSTSRAHPSSRTYTHEDYVLATTQEYQGLAEAIAAAEQEEHEPQAVAASMPGLETGVVGFEDVIGAEGKEIDDTPPRPLRPGAAGGDRYRTGRLVRRLALRRWVVVLRPGGGALGSGVDRAHQGFAIGRARSAHPVRPGWASRRRGRRLVVRTCRHGRCGGSGHPRGAPLLRRGAETPGPGQRRRHRPRRQSGSGCSPSPFPSPGRPSRWH